MRSPAGKPRTEISRAVALALLAALTGIIANLATILDMILGWHR